MVVDSNLELSLAVFGKTHAEFIGLTDSQTVMTCSSATPTAERHSLPFKRSTFLKKPERSMIFSIPTEIVLGMVGKSDQGKIIVLRFES